MLSWVANLEVWSPSREGSSARRGGRPESSRENGACWLLCPQEPQRQSGGLGWAVPLVSEPVQRPRYNQHPDLWDQRWLKTSQGTLLDLGVQSEVRTASRRQDYC